MARGSHHRHVVVERVLGLGQSFRQFPLGRRVHLSGPLHIQRLVRTTLVEFLAEAVEALLLDERV
jgi:hypothetical protein